MARFKGGRTIYLTKPQIEQAIAATRSNQAAASYLKVSFPTYKRYASLFKNDEGVSLFEAHKNKSGKGIIKPRDHGGKFKLDDILMGKHPTYPRDKLFRRMINSKYVAEECSHCGFAQKRATDLKTPIILNHKNGNITDHRLDNLEILCYNCYFLFVGNLNINALRNLEKYIKVEPDLVVDYSAANSSPETSRPDDILTDEEKMNLIRTIQGI